MVYNKSKINNYNYNLGYKVTQLNQIVFGFQIGQNLDETFYDEDYWSYELFQIKFNKTEEKIPA